MDKALEAPLRKFVEAYATQNTENAAELIHEYICRKAQLILLGEACDDEDMEEDKKDDKEVDDDIDAVEKDVKKAKKAQEKDIEDDAEDEDEDSKD